MLSMGTSLGMEMKLSRKKLQSCPPGLQREHLISVCVPGAWLMAGFMAGEIINTP